MHQSSACANLIITILAALLVAPVLLGAASSPPEEAELLQENTSSVPDEYIEPRVNLYAGVLPKAVCQELIKLGEQSGFNVIEESIDDYQENKVPSQSIEVLSYEKGGQHRIIDRPIWNALEPYFELFASLIKKTRKADEHRLLYPDEPDREPELDWIFFRKYSPINSSRNSLIPHLDTNVHTLNIALNDDFEGGGLFYVKPPMQDVTLSDDGRPDLKPEMMSYDWVNTVKRENTSDLVFPNMQAGDVLIHNYTVWHGVAPLEKGERYSFVLFYDMDNPNINDMDDINEFDVEFYHEIEDAKVVLVFVEELANGKEILEPMIDPFPPYEARGLNSFEGHKFRAIVEGTTEVLAEFVVSSELKNHRYVISKQEQDSYDEL
jgi:hypothetical protein